MPGNQVTEVTQRRCPTGRGQATFLVGSRQILFDCAQGRLSPR